MSVTFMGVGDMFAHPDIGRPDHIPVVATNTIGVMGAGQALAYSRWDEAGYEEYRYACLSGDHTVGKVLFIDGTWGDALCFPTMSQPGEQSWLPNIDAATVDWARLTGDLEPGITWHVPMLGCGIGRLDWPDVAAVLVARLDGIEGHEFLLYGPDPQHEGGDA